MFSSGNTATPAMAHFLWVTAEMSPVAFDTLTGVLFASCQKSQFTAMIEAGVCTVIHLNNWETNKK